MFALGKRNVFHANSADFCLRGVKIMPNASVVARLPSNAVKHFDVILAPNERDCEDK